MKTKSKICCLDLISLLSLIGILALSALPGCATKQNPAIERAELQLQNARENPDLTANATLFLDQASGMLDKAKKEWKQDKESDEVAHLIYLSERNLAIAREESRRKVAQSSNEFHRQQALRAAGNIRTQQAEERARLSDASAQFYRRQAEDNRNLIEQLRRDNERLNSADTERGLELTLANDVLFEVDGTNLKAGAMRQLQPIAEFLKSHPARSIIVEGHTDNTGSDSYNQSLSQQRAEAVRRYFEDNSIENSRIECRGLGEAYPLASNDTEAGRLQNRRVQIIIQDDKGSV